MKSMFMRNMALGAASLALAVGIAPAANATVFHTFHIGDMPNFYITSGTPFSSSITANFGNGFTGPVSFDDTYEFTIPQTGTGSGSISTSFSSLSNKLTISSVIINGTPYVVPSNGSGQYLAVSGIPIVANVMNTIEVLGATSSKGGTYSGTATFSAAVPETASWVMMLGGFGLIGAAMRRRKTSLTFA